MPRKKKQQPDQPVSDRPELVDPLNTALESEAAVDAEAELVAAASDTFDQASDGLPETIPAEVILPAEDSAPAEEQVESADIGGSNPGTIVVTEIDEEHTPEPAGKQERLQKILAQAGIASRRHAEELITEGRVQVNGKVVTELGSKADPNRDHIRVDGKLLQGSERHRYFMLNKPKGYVTTVSDPEGRPTIMEFFSKTRERLYPVGRLDYLSEGLLLVTNDGELANKLTRAASNVEKTYLVKVSGQPSEEDLDRLREGVGIDRGKPGSARVQTAPAQIRLFRPPKAGAQRGPARFGHNTGSPRTGPGPRGAENPWYEVVLIEGRNRELRKMFEEIGHHVEKIRRIGYGPLELDLEPGKTRELDPKEIENLRRAAEGKYRKPKAPESRKREFPPRSQRPDRKPEWKERRGGFSKGGDASLREDRGRFQGRSRDFEERTEAGKRPWQGGPGRRPERADSRQRPPRGESSGESPREFRPGGRPPSRFIQDRPGRPRRDDRERSPHASDRENRGQFAEKRPYQGAGGPKRFGSRPPRRDFGQTDRPERRPDRGTSENRGQFAEKRPYQRSDRPKRFGSRAPNRDFETREYSDRPRFEERPQQRTGAPRPFRRDQRGPENRPRFEGKPQQQFGGARPFARNRPDREDQPRFERPRSEERPPQKGRPPRRDNQDRNDRRDRPGSPRPGSARPGGSFKPGKRSAPGGKQGSARSGPARRSGPRPGGNRSNKRRP